ncbi:MAG: phosphoribosyltransferase family protein [Aigarchaeota archaeon]|nr:phosphoribosyltransferase family protein [Aigarchaeota archaeon]MCX8192722.1 phosphoribosyltransferase family protein [Nitrososphaeria archaeon]MDW7985974.1 phosphoribosyltransferase family protein [Nitrososphaerota archaeon]
MGEYVFAPYTGQEYYELNIQGFKRRLPMVRVDEDVWIAYFDSLGDREFISHCANILVDYLRDTELLMTAESKGIALVHEISQKLGHPYYVVCRKELKPFMKDPIVVKYKPITSRHELVLCIDGRYRDRIAGKKVGIVDDIVSTGETIKAMKKIVEEAGGEVVKTVAVLVEGEYRTDVQHLGILPLFKKSK